MNAKDMKSRSLLRVLTRSRIFKNTLQLALRLSMKRVVERVVVPQEHRLWGAQRLLQAPHKISYVGDGARSFKDLASYLRQADEIY